MHEENASVFQKASVRVTQPSAFLDVILFWSALKVGKYLDVEPLVIKEVENFQCCGKPQTKITEQ